MIAGQIHYRIKAENRCGSQPFVVFGSCMFVVADGLPYCFCLWPNMQKVRPNMQKVGSNMQKVGLICKKFTPFPAYHFTIRPKSRMKTVLVCHLG